MSRTVSLQRTFATVDGQRALFALVQCGSFYSARITVAGQEDSKPFTNEDKARAYLNGQWKAMGAKRR